MSSQPTELAEEDFARMLHARLDSLDVPVRPWAPVRQDLMHRLRRRRVRAVAAASAVAAAAAVTGVVVATTSTTPSPTPPQRAGCLLPTNSSAPFPGGHQTTFAGAQSAVRIPILVPHTALADRRTLSQVWVSRASRTVALVYGKRKITILIMPWPVAQSPGKWFRHERRIMITKYATIGRVNGKPALIVLKPNIDYCHANPPLVEFYWRGTDIRVFSTSYGAPALLRIADSMR